MRAHYAPVIATLWLAWLLYWLIAAVGTKPSVRRESSWSRAARAVPLYAAAALLFIRSEPSGGFLFERFVPSSAPIARLGLALVCGGLALGVWARLYLGRNWSGNVTVKQDHELVRGGPYARIRHPIYTGLLLALFGSALALGQWRGLLAVALAFGAFWYKLRLEERWMRETFGEVYACYQRQSWALIPWLL